MKRTILLLIAILIWTVPAAAKRPDDVDAGPGPMTFLPFKHVEGTLLVFKDGDAKCYLFVSEEGLGAGASSMFCLRYSYPADTPMTILKVVQTNN